MAPETRMDYTRNCMGALQDSDVTFWWAWDVFGIMRTQYPVLNYYTGPDNNIPGALSEDYTKVDFRDFERGLYKLQTRRHGLLTAGEAHAVRRFLKPVAVAPAPAVAPAEEPILPWVQRVTAGIVAQIDAEVGVSPYVCTKYVQCTSNVVERLFSCAKNIDNPLRNMKPATLEMLLMFTKNRTMWDLALVTRALNPPVVPLAAAPVAPVV